MSPRASAAARAAWALCLACAAGIWAQSLPGFKLIPYPRTLVQGQGSLVLAEGSHIAAATPELAQFARILSNEVFVLTGKRLKPVIGAGTAGDIVLKPDAALDTEGYVVDIGDRAEIRGGAYRGVVHGATTFLQMLAAGGKEAKVAKAKITDSPESPYRALLVDVARNPHTMANLRWFVQYCRLYKISYLQFHMTDDQGITFPFASVDSLTGKNYNGIPVYAKQEWIDLVKFADDRGVFIVPEMEMPGHAGTMVRARPDLFRTGTYHGSTLNIADSAAVAALKSMVTELCEVFRSTPFFHIGADEADMSKLGYGQTDGVYPEVRRQWDARLDTLTARMRKAGRLGATERLTSPEEVYKDFVNQMNAHIKSLGKRTIMWEGFYPGPKGVEVEKDIRVMPFDIFYNPAVYMDAGHEVINASWTPLYMITQRDTNQGIKPVLDSIYAWNKMAFDIHPSRVTATSRIVVPEQYAKDLPGAMMCIWETPEKSDSLIIRNRLAAMAERLWNQGLGLTFADFKARLAGTEPVQAGLMAAAALSLPALETVSLRPAGHATAARKAKTGEVRSGAVLWRSNSPTGEARLLRSDGRESRVPPTDR